jgi:sugar porter (SP) family MFS transporter
MSTLYGTVNSLPALAALLGSLLGGNLATTTGRRGTMFIADLFCILGTGLQLLQRTALLLTGRFILGLAIGLNSTVIPLYVSEMSPTELTGFFGAFHQIFICLGIFVAYLLGLNVPRSGSPDLEKSDWGQVMIALTIAVSLLRVILLATVFRCETPTLLTIRGQHVEAQHVISQYYLPEIEGEKLANLREEVSNSSKSTGALTFAQLLGPQYRRALFLGCFLSFLQQFCGINAIILYSKSIFRAGHSGEEAEAQATLYTVLVGLINLVSAILCSLVIDKGGRKTLLLAGSVSMMLMLTALGILGFAEIHQFSKWLILVYTFLFGMSLGPIVWLYAAEILPDKGISVAVATNWICTLIVAQGIPLMKDSFITINGCFLIFAACLVMGSAVIMLGVVETKGLSKTDIQRLFSQGG